LIILKLNIFVDDSYLLVVKYDAGE